MIKRSIKKALTAASKVAVKSAATTVPGRFALDQFLASAMGRVQTVSHQGNALTFSVPNSLNLFRVDTFSTKEPETLDWIDSLAPGSVLWDIGANIGLYSCYAAKARGCHVFAFEPSVFNLELLARNIYLNGLTSQITIVPLPLTNELARSTLNMSTTEWGGALSTFGQQYGFDGKPLLRKFEFATIGISIVDAMRLLKIPTPNYIKMDVDGIEHLVLSGGGPILRTIDGISIEINDAFQEQATEATRLLEDAGLRFIHKKHSGMIESNTGGFDKTFNQVWERPAASRNGSRE